MKVRKKMCGSNTYATIITEVAHGDTQVTIVIGGTVDCHCVLRILMVFHRWQCILRNNKFLVFPLPHGTGICRDLYWYWISRFLFFFLLIFPRFSNNNTDSQLVVEATEFNWNFFFLSMKIGNIPLTENKIPLCWIRFKAVVIMTNFVKTSYRYSELGALYFLLPVVTLITTLPAQRNKKYEMVSQSN